MRVTNAPMYRKYSTAVNDVHSKLNKAMNKISSGAAYEAAADNPLAYYQGKKMDHQYQDVESKLQLMSDVQNRIYQQELGAREIQSLLSKAKNSDIEYILNGTNNVDMTTVGTIQSSLLQKQQSMVNALNAQYENFYIYGGNDLSTAPFTMSGDGKTLTFSHQFPGEDQATKIELVMGKITKADGTEGYGFSVGNATDGDGKTLTQQQALEKIQKSMTERGYVDLGYGTIDDKTTLLDTFTSGFSVLTGLSADKAAALSDPNDPAVLETNLLDALNNSAVGLMGQALAATETYLKDGDLEKFTGYLGGVMDEMTLTEDKISNVYSDLGTKYSLIDTTEDRLKDIKYGLIEQYKDKLGADPYESIMEMYSFQQSYNASLQLSSKLMEASLFNFIS